MIKANGRIDWTTLLGQAPTADEMVVENAVKNVMASYPAGTADAELWFAGHITYVEWGNFVAIAQDDVLSLIEATPDKHLVALGQFLEQCKYEREQLNKMVEGHS